MRSMLWKLVGWPAFRCTVQNWYGVRRAILRLFGATLADTTKVRPTTRIDRPWNLRAGALTVMGDDATLICAAPITIGDRCVVSQYTYLTTESRDLNNADRRHRREAITLEDDVWIATDTLVLPGSHVRAGTVVGARAMVDGELAGWSIATGEPAVVRAGRSLYEA